MAISYTWEWTLLLVRMNFTIYLNHLAAYGYYKLAQVRNTMIGCSCYRFITGDMGLAGPCRGMDHVFLRVKSS